MKIKEIELLLDKHFHSSPIIDSQMELDKVKDYINQLESQLRFLTTSERMERERRTENDEKLLKCSCVIVDLNKRIEELEADKLELSKGYIELAENSDYNHDIFILASKCIKEVEK